MAKTPRERLRERRLQRRLTLEQASQTLGYSKSSVSAIERGERFPGLEMALAIEREFGIPLREWSRDAR